MPEAKASSTPAKASSQAAPANDASTASAAPNAQDVPVPDEATSQASSGRRRERNNARRRERRQEERAAAADPPRDPGQASTDKGGGKGKSKTTAGRPGRARHPEDVLGPRARVAAALQIPEGQEVILECLQRLQAERL